MAAPGNNSCRRLTSPVRKARQLILRRAASAKQVRVEMQDSPMWLGCVIQVLLGNSESSVLCMGVACPDSLNADLPPKSSQFSMFRPTTLDKSKDVHIDLQARGIDTRMPAALQPGF